MATCSATTLINQAATDAIIGLDSEQRQLAVLLQLLCNYSAVAGNTPALIFDNLNPVLAQMLNQAHGLPQTPRRLRFVIKMVNAVAAYSVGDEIDGKRIGTASAAPAFTWGANSTNVWVANDNEPGAGDSMVILKTGASYISLLPTDYVGKLYVWV